MDAVTGRHIQHIGFESRAHHPPSGSGIRHPGSDAPSDPEPEPAVGRGPAEYRCASSLCLHGRATGSAAGVCRLLAATGCPRSAAHGSLPSLCPPGHVTRRHSEAAVAAGADVLVAQGNEAGGHTGTMSLLPFLAGVVRRYPDVPVLAAGGIGDGRTLAAVLTAGADGAWLGTAFLGAPPDPDTSEIIYGQSASFVDGVRPAADVVRAICDEAEAILDSRPRSLLGRPTT
ncbi:nitronate monooxygenase [Streptomyces decoyicus]|uniref:nitronate monooxygenase n=1 Tax=Streptomyces decoyicus TaxID=249567 RepID=UPI00362DBDFA